VDIHTRIGCKDLFRIGGRKMLVDLNGTAVARIESEDEDVLVIVYNLVGRPTELHLSASKCEELSKALADTARKAREASPGDEEQSKAE
jgi:hypothetical protein